MTYFKLLNILFFTVVLVGCGVHDTVPEKKNKMFTYLALGDSYTIGESIAVHDRWPNQLTQALSEELNDIEPALIVAKTGWRTDEMLKTAKDQVGSRKFDLVSLLIGVNNEFQGQDTSIFAKEFESCLKYAISKGENANKSLFVLSIPDYGFTPFGQSKQEQISQRVNQFNEIIKRIVEKYNVLFFNITPLSRKGLFSPSLVAFDGLHPSGEQYGSWVQHILPQVQQMIKSQ
jgi:acyl-CoA thioesterase-1